MHSNSQYEKESSTKQIKSILKKNISAESKKQIKHVHFSLANDEIKKEEYFFVKKEWENEHNLDYIYDLNPDNKPKKESSYFYRIMEITLNMVIYFLNFYTDESLLDEELNESEIYPYF